MLTKVVMRAANIKTWLCIIMLKHDIVDIYKMESFNELCKIFKVGIISSTNVKEHKVRY